MIDTSRWAQILCAGGLVVALAACQVPAISGMEMDAAPPSAAKMREVIADVPRPIPAEPPPAMRAKTPSAMLIDLEARKPDRVEGAAPAKPVPLPKEPRPSTRVK